MANEIFVNLPVKDLKRTMEFFGRLNFKFNPQFSDQNAACMMVSREIFVMLLVEDFFKTFTRKELVDAHRGTEVIVALSADSRAGVDALVDAALQAGGKPVNEPQEYDFMYSRSFEDLYVHQWEVVYMDPAHVQPY